VLLVVAVIVVAVSSVLATARLSADAITSMRAQLAADAAALAAVQGGIEAAHRAARENAAVLVWMVDDEGDVVVSVDVGRTRAVARAGR
jgi:hypothetical protein